MCSAFSACIAVLSQFPSSHQSTFIEPQYNKKGDKVVLSNLLVDIDHFTC